MIDIKHLVECTELYINEMEKRGMDEYFVITAKELYLQINIRKQELDSLRTIKNNFNSQVMALHGEQKLDAIADMKANSEKIKELEFTVKTEEQELQSLIYKIPNLTWEQIPVGKNDEHNVVKEVFGMAPKFSFTPQHYYELPLFKRDYHAQAGVDAVGARGYYITGKLAMLQRALYRWVEDRILDSGFEYVIPPIMVNEAVMYGTGFFPSGKNDFYTVNPGEDDLYLVGSSEPSLMYLYHDKKLDLDNPKLLTANTTCFRREAGSYGQDTKGGIRVHQFEKIEQVVLCKPSESAEQFNKLTEFFTQTATLLGLHIHQLEVCTGDISLKNNRQIDIEAWFPAQDKFRELCSSSNCTDFQTRNINIKYQTDQGDYQLAHSLNCTGITNRTMFAILEQFQQADGSVAIPEVLQSYCKFEVLS
jgi:seryl-tRNA synthetase